MKFYGLKSCDTCRRAQKEILASGQTFEAIDVRADGLSADVISTIISAFGDAAINRASQPHGGACLTLKKLAIPASYWPHTQP